MTGIGIATAIKTTRSLSLQGTLPPLPSGQAGEETPASKTPGVIFACTSEARTFDSTAPADATATLARQVDTKQGPSNLKTPPGQTKVKTPAPHASIHIQQTLQMDFLQVNIVGEAL